MDEDSDDYMSNIFVHECNSKKSTQLTSSEARKHKLFKTSHEKNLKHKTSQVSRSVLEKVNRTEGLKTHIGSENVGFKLLKKMGYNPGTSLGKRGNERTAPIDISLKVNRTGLGMDSLIQEKQLEKKEIILSSMASKRQAQEVLLQNFMLSQRQRVAERGVLKDLAKAQHICQELDRNNDVTTPLEAYFWPSSLKEDVNAEDCDVEDYIVEEDEDSVTSDVQLSRVVHYLRKRYNYCIWCTISFEDIEDMSQNCPGEDAQSHE